KRNNRAVERKMSDCLRQDRARIQVGRISHFGLLEMSRQRIRASVLESSTEPCPHCGGSGHVRSVSSVALQLLRGLEEILMKGPTHNLTVRTRTDVALYVLNHKRGHLRDLESSFKVTLAVIADATITGQQSFVIDRGEQIHTLEAAKAILAAQVAAFPPEIEDTYVEEDEFEGDESELEGDETEDASAETAVPRADGESEGPRRKRRRRRRGGRGGEAREGAPGTEQTEFASAPEGEETGEADDDSEDETDEPNGEARADQSGNGERRPRRRGRRGGRRRRNGTEGAAPEDGLAAAIVDDLEPFLPSEAVQAAADLDAAPVRAQDNMLIQPEQEQAAQDADKAVRRRSTVREKVSFLFGGEAPSEPAPLVNITPAQSQEPEQDTQAPQSTESENAPRRAGWWSRRSSE
ncbi:MAG TPA: ribonuclease E/G, partial [Afipia sp.]